MIRDAHAVAQDVIASMSPGQLRKLRKPPPADRKYYEPPMQVPTYLVRELLLIVEGQS